MFLTELKNKLTYAYEAKLVELESLAATEITTVNTVTTLATHSASTLKAADIIKVGYLATVDNQTGNNEIFTFTLDLGTTTFTRNITVNTTDTDRVAITATLTRVNSTSFLAEVNFIHINEAGTIVQYPAVQIVTDSNVTECTITAENTSAVDAGCDLIGSGGYLLIDSL